MLLYNLRNVAAYLAGGRRVAQHGERGTGESYITQLYYHPLY